MNQRIFSTIGTMLLFFLSACEYNPPVRIGFQSSFHEESDGNVLIHVDHHDDFILLEGNLRVDQGAIDVELLDPCGNVAFFTQISATQNIDISEHMNPQRGIWKLRYKSREGSGSIDLHLNVR